MKSCDYCGTETDQASAVCKGCGAVFRPPLLPPEPPPVVSPFLFVARPFWRPLNGATATIVLLIFLGAQFAAGIVAGFLGGVMMGMRGGNFGYDYRDTMQAIMPWTSLGHPAAAALTTFIFVLMHLTELVHEPLATFAIGGLALLALWRRLRSKAIGPAIAVHVGYNSMIALVVLLST